MTTRSLQSNVSLSLRLLLLELRALRSQGKESSSGWFRSVAFPALRFLVLVVLVDEFFLGIATGVARPQSLDPWVRMRTLMGLVVVWDFAQRWVQAQDRSQRPLGWLAALPIPDATLRRSRRVARVLSGPLCTVGFPLTCGLALHTPGARLLPLAPLVLAWSLEALADLAARIVDRLPGVGFVAAREAARIVSTLLFALFLLAFIDGGNWQSGLVPGAAEWAAGLLQWGPGRIWMGPAALILLGVALLGPVVPRPRVQRREPVESQLPGGLLLLGLVDPSSTVLHAVAWTAVVVGLFRGRDWAVLHVWLASAPVALLAATRLGLRSAACGPLLLTLPEEPHRPLLRAALVLSAVAGVTSALGGLTAGLRPDVALNVGALLGAALLLSVAVARLAAGRADGRAVTGALVATLSLGGLVLLSPAALHMRVSVLLLGMGAAVVVWERLARRLGSWDDPARQDRPLDGVDALAATGLFLVLAAAWGGVSSAAGVDSLPATRLLAGQGGALLALVIAARRRGSLPRGTPSAPGRFGVGVALGAGAAAGVLWLAGEGLGLDIAAAPSAAPSLLALAGAVLVAPFFEEWTMRGLLLPALARRHGTGLAVLASAAVFAGLHLDGGWPLRIALGLIFGLGSLRGGLAAAVGLHAGANLYGMLRGLV